jgi:hypothetical protein
MPKREMMTILPRLIRCTAALGIAIAAVPLHAETFGDSSDSLQIVWSTPVVADPPYPTEPGKFSLPERGLGLVLTGTAIWPDGHLLFLGSLVDPTSLATVLLMGAELHGPDDGQIELKLHGVKSTPATIWSWIFGENRNYGNPIIGSIAVGGINTIWLGGSTNAHTGLASDAHADAYIAKLDKSAKPIWERAYGPGNVPFVTGIAPAANGDVAVVAQNGWFAPAWLALLGGGDGHVIWERRFGNGKGVAIEPVEGHRFIVASFDSEGTGRTYNENVAVRTVSADGQVGDPTIVRRAISNSIGAYFGSIKMAAAPDGAYVLSSWGMSDTARLQPSEIAKVSARGKLLWSRTLPDSFVTNNDGSAATFCTDPAIAMLSTGDALVACALRGQIHLHRLSGDTGNDEEDKVPLPECNDEIHPVTLFLLAREDGTVFIGGSRPPGNVGPGCSWLARLLQRRG